MRIHASHAPLLGRRPDRLLLCLGVFMLLAMTVSRASADNRPPGEVRLTLERYEALLAAARNSDGPAITWGRAGIRVTLPAEADGFVTVQLTAQARVVGEGQPELVLLPADVVLESAQLSGSEATLIRRAGAHVMLLPKGTSTAQVSLRYLVPARRGARGRTALIPILPVPGSTLTVAGEPTDIWPAGKITRSGGETTARLPSAPAVALRFDSVGGGVQVRRTDYSLAVDDAGQGSELTTTYVVRVEGEGGYVRLAPASTALVSAAEEKTELVTRVKGGWHQAKLSGAGEHTVTARFRLPVDRSQGQPMIAIALDEAPITKVTAAIPGKRAVTLSPEVPLETKHIGEGEAVKTEVVGWLPPSRSAVVRWTESRPSAETQVRINTDTFQLVNIQEGVMRSKVHVRYQILRGQTRELALEIPEGVVLYKVEGEGIDDWRTVAKTDETARQARVFLARERTGAYSLTLELETVVPKTEDAPLDIPVVRPLNVFRETGVVALFDGDKVGFAPADQTGYTVVGQDALPVDIRQALKSTVSQAFKHIGRPEPMRSKLSKLEARETLFDARVLSLYTVKEGAILANSTVKVEVKSGKSDRLVLTVPEDVTILSVIAPSLSRKGDATEVDAGEGRKAYELKFSQAFEGTIEAHLEYELVVKKAGDLRLPDIRVLGAEVEEGSFGITAETGIEVKPAKEIELRRVDVGELPESVRRRAVGEREILIGYQYAHVPWSLVLDVLRHETVETLTAAVTAAWLETTVLADGQLVTRAIYDVRNEDRQFLRLTLPDAARVWTVTSNGQPIKAVQDARGKVAIPLRKRQTARIELVYNQSASVGEGLWLLSMTAPEADALITDLQWRVRSPGEMPLFSTFTEMRRDEVWRDHGAGQIEGTPVGAPVVGETVERIFTQPVIEAGAAAPSLMYLLINAGPSSPEDQTMLWAGLGGFFGLFILLLIIVVLRARKSENG